MIVQKINVVPMRHAAGDIAGHLCTMYEQDFSTFVHYIVNAELWTVVIDFL